MSIGIHNISNKYPFQPANTSIRYLLNVWHLCLAAILFVVSGVSAVRVDASTHSDRFIIHFPVNKAEIDTTFAFNRQTLDSLRNVAVALASDSSLCVTSLRFNGYASPEGSDSFNRRLARDRRQAIEKYLSAYYQWPDSVAETNYIVYDSLQAKIYLEASPAGKSRLVRTFNRLRYASVEIDYLQRQQTAQLESATEIIEPLVSEVADEEVFVDEVVTAPADSDISVDEVVIVPEDNTAEDDLTLCKPLYIGLKTNMLYDALLIPTLGAEAYIGRGFSISGQWSYAWWSRDTRHRYWRFYGGDLGLRRWFGSKSRQKPLTGHHIGVYAQLFTYDFETGGRGEMGAKFNYGGGIEYGFSLPVSRRLNIDFSIGIGYVTGRYYDYTPIDGHYVWQATHKRQWFGPTKAEISLVWLIGCDNYNVKGGAR